MEVPVDRTPSDGPVPPLSGGTGNLDAVDKPQSPENGTKKIAPSPKNNNTNSGNENMNMNENGIPDCQQPCEVKNGLKRAVLRRQASLSAAEKAFLRALLVDPVSPLPAQQQSSVSDDTSKSDLEGSESHTTSDPPPCHKEQMSRATSVLDDDVLFSLPFGGRGDDVGGEDQHVSARGQSIQPPRTRRNQSHHIGLWRAHEDGIAPKEIRRFASQVSSMMENKEEDASAQLKRLKSRRSSKAPKSQTSLAAGDENEGKDEDDAASASSFGDSIHSDEEVRRDKDDLSSTSSWDLSEGGFDHYDAWALLKDEYADDFGFSYRDGIGDAGALVPDSDEESDSAHIFKIIGTSADDIAAHPHVLSPPLMDSLLNFVPDSIADQNFWLKFSLVRDGANLDILKRYVRAAPNTILAIETTNGDVFGAFTSSPWRQSPAYFGSGQSFLWKMRYNRMTPCHSLFEQAHLESEIDVYFYSGLNDYVQLCTADKLAVGGGELDTTGKEEHGDDVAGAPYVYLEEGEHYGFGIAVCSDLLQGTSSPCATFRNPCLVNHSSKGEVFEIVNLEVWSFTPCETLDAAEKLEMTKFFVQESVLSSISSLDSARFESGMHSRRTSILSGADLKQENFYRRVGQEDEEDRLERMGWEYQNMMRPGGSNSMRSPYFASNGSPGPGDLGMHSPRM
mmetsp:Transcript_21792/g.47567  ORF Transcript_21792/g.47567 Transcript_21792/m.47567 type:complete len:677 (-) Transcript_21792:46-2076(-)